ETSQARDRHLAYFVDWAEAAAPQLLGAEQATWYERLETDHDNLRAAAQWARDSRQPAAGLRLASATWEFWIARGHQAEWLERLNDLLALPEAAAQDGPSAQARVRGLNTAGFSQWHQGYPATARNLLEEAFELARVLGDQQSLAIALRYQGLVSISEGDADGARSCFEQSLEIMRRLDDRYQLGWSLAMLADLSLRQNDER